MRGRSSRSYTLNGNGFPATAPIVAGRGDTIRIRYMNEGLQIHPVHLHGMPQKVIAVDGHHGVAASARVRGRGVTRRARTSSTR